MQPDISYIVSNYNSADFLIGLLDDLLNRQSHRNIEVIVVDSASDDDSVQRVKEHPDTRLHLIEQPERTPYGVSWLEGWKVAKGKVVANSNTDDRSYPWRTSQVLAAYNEGAIGGKKYFYYGGYETWRDNVCVARGVPPAYTEEDLSQFFRCGVHVHWDNALRELVDWDRMFRAGFEYKSAFDYWLVLYFMSLGALGFPIRSCFSIYNQRDDSLEQSDKDRNTFESLRAIEEFYPNGISMQNFKVHTKAQNPTFFYRYVEFCKEFTDE